MLFEDRLKDFEKKRELCCKLLLHIYLYCAKEKLYPKYLGIRTRAFRILTCKIQMRRPFGCKKYLFFSKKLLQFFCFCDIICVYIHLYVKCERR